MEVHPFKKTSSVVIAETRKVENITFEEGRSARTLPEQDSTNPDNCTTNCTTPAGHYTVPASASRLTASTLWILYIILVIFGLF